MHFRRIEIFLKKSCSPNRFQSTRCSGFQGTHFVPRRVLLNEPDEPDVFDPRRLWPWHEMNKRTVALYYRATKLCSEWQRYRWDILNIWFDAQHREFIPFAIM